MADFVLPFLLAMTCLLSAAAVAFALAYWRAVSPSTRRPKQPSSPPPTLGSDAATLAQMAADQAALFSTLEKLTTTVKRLSSRAGMRDHREQERGEPPVGTSKADLLRHYGMSGKVGPSFAQAQLELESRNAQQQRSN